MAAFMAELETVGDAACAGCLLFLDGGFLAEAETVGDVCAGCLL